MRKLVKIEVTQDEVSTLLKKELLKTINLGAPFDWEKAEVDWTNFFEKERRVVGINLWV